MTVTILDALLTDRLALRRFTAADGPALHAYLGRPEAVEFEPHGPVSAKHAARAAAEHATEACAALLEQVFAEGAHRVVASCNPANTRSWPPAADDRHRSRPPVRSTPCSTRVDLARPSSPATRFPRTTPQIGRP